MAKNKDVSNQLEVLQTKIDHLISEVTDLLIEGKTLSIKQAHDNNDIKNLKNDLEKLRADYMLLKEDLRKEFSEKFVSNDKFDPVKMIAYGLTSMILVAVGTALLGLIL